MISEVDRQRFQNLLAEEDQRAVSRIVGEPLRDLRMSQGSGDSFGGREFDASLANKRQVMQESTEVATARI